MRKFFEGHSLVGVTLILTSFVFALLLRFYQLDSAGPWNDELASLWYAGNLSVVFRDETHSPLYYGVLRLLFGNSAELIQLRYFSATLSAVHLIECFYLGKQVFKRNAFLVFWILICLSPIDIIYARMARHYAWFLEGTIVFYLLWKWDRHLWLKYLVAGFMVFIHVFFLVPLSVLTFWRYKEKRDVKDLVLSALSAAPVLVYYSVKYIQFGESSMLQNISWNIAGNFEFYALLVTQFFGEVSPRNLFYPVNPLMAGFLFILSVGLILFKRKDSAKIFFITFLISLVSVELLGVWNNFRVNRYFIFLVSFWIVALAEAFEEMSEKVSVLVLFVVLGMLVWINPLKEFPWDKERVEAWREFQTRHPIAQQVECSFPYQAAYFHLNTESCENQLRKIDPRLPLLYFDLSGGKLHYVLQLMDVMNATDYRQIDRGKIIRFDPKDKSNAEK